MLSSKMLSSRILSSKILSSKILGSKILSSKILSSKKVLTMEAAQCYHWWFYNSVSVFACLLMALISN